MPSEVRSRFVLANGVRTHYSEAGVTARHRRDAWRRRWLVGSRGWAAARKTRGDFRLIAPDSVGGFGLTDPFAPVPYGLMSRVPIPPIDRCAVFAQSTLIGNSQGAGAAAVRDYFIPTASRKSF